MQSSSTGVETTQQSDAALIPWLSNTPWWPATVLTDSIRDLNLQGEAMGTEIAWLTQQNEGHIQAYRELEAQYKGSSNDSDRARLLRDLEHCRIEKDQIDAQLRQCQSTMPAAISFSLTQAEREALVTSLNDLITTNKQMTDSIEYYGKLAVRYSTSENKLKGPMTNYFKRVEYDMKKEGEQLRRIRRRLGGN